MGRTRIEARSPIIPARDGYDDMMTTWKIISRPSVLTSVDFTTIVNEDIPIWHSCCTTPNSHSVVDVASCKKAMPNHFFVTMPMVIGSSMLSATK